jgi:hypothetical protein
MEKKILDFIDNDDFYKAVKKVLESIKESNKKENKKIYKNSVDPFSAVFDAFGQNISLGKWLKQEEKRQIQKTLQNNIGIFHQEIIGSIPGWKDLETGNVIDVINKKRKIIAEIKNKHNTTKGNHKIAIYDDFKKILSDGNHDKYTAYYVEIIPKNKKIYNKEFTPSDNKTKRKRPSNKNIRIIDGKSFYNLITNKEDSIEKLYKSLPIVIGKILNKNHDKIAKDPLFNELFNRIY